MNNSNNNSIGFFGVLTIVFIVLKLCHMINWSWVCILMPMWIPFMIILIAVMIRVIFMEN